MKNKLFGNSRYKLCAYCSQVKKSEDGAVLYCERKGIVETNHKCRHFTYDPFKRVPRSVPVLPTYDPEDFVF